MTEINQVFRQTPATHKAEQEILKYIKSNPLPFDKKIGMRLFNALLKETKKEERFKYAASIPYRFDTGNGVIEYTLRIK
jgi:hypothetical protein